MIGDPALQELAEIDRDVAGLLIRRSRLVAKLASSYSADAVVEWEYACERNLVEQLGDYTPHEDITEPLNYLWNMARSRMISKAAKVACLGPAGTFSHITALRLFAGNVEFVLLPNSRQIIEMVSRNDCTLGVIPLKNARSGAVFENVELLAIAASRGVQIKESHDVLIELSLMGTGRLQDIRSVLSHPQAISQCKGNIDNLRLRIGSEIQVVETASTSDAARLVSLDLTKSSAAILHQKTGFGYGLSMLIDPFEDRLGASTNFAVIGRESEIEFPRSGRESTALVFRLNNQNEPGALVGVLGCLAGFNLTSVQSWSPDDSDSHGMNREYMFFVELEGDRANESFIFACNKMVNHCALGYPKILGSYLRPEKIEGMSFRG